MEFEWIDLTFNACFISAFWFTVYAFWGFYHEITRKSRVVDILSLLVIAIVGCVIITSFYSVTRFTIDNYRDYITVLLLYFSIHFFISSITKVFLMNHTKELIYDKKIVFNTLIIGANQNAKEIHDEIESISHLLGWKFVGYLYIEMDTNILGDKVKCLGNISILDKIIESYQIEQVVIAIQPEEHSKIENILETLEYYELRVSIIPDLYQIMVGQVSISHVFSIPLIEINRDLMPFWQKNLKRSLDIIASLFVLIFFSPFLLGIALATILNSKGPALFFQERLGKGGLPFKIIKFRSMYTDAEKLGPALSSDTDKRITPWGKIMRKTRLDELPQFYNVLVGDMSLVGPRPERDFYMKQILKRSPNFKYRLRVKPGITSLAQVKFGYAENVEEMIRRLKYDIFYIKNMSILMDFRIMFFTVYTVIKGRGK